VDCVVLTQLVIIQLECCWNVSGAWLYSFQDPWT